MTYLSESDAGKRIYQRCDEWAVYSEPGPGVTRLYLSNEHRAAADKLLDWMAEAGMDAHIDEAGNIIGRYHAETGAGPYLIMGSHQDSVIEGGKYDGPLGILTALDCVAVLNSENVRFPFGIEVVGFGDEEGSRFKTTLAGSRAIVGTVDNELLNASDRDGRTIAQALTDFGLDPANIGRAAHSSDDVVGYVEVHIEQGPVLEDEDRRIAVKVKNSQRLTIVSNRNNTFECNFEDSILGPREDQEVTFSRVVECVDSALSGFNSTIFAYGQTGYTVFEVISETEQDSSFYEVPGTYNVVNGFHNGTLQNQDISIPAIVESQAFNAFAFGGGVESNRIKDNITTRELDELTSNICLQKLLEHPDYGKLAARVSIDNHHKKIYFRSGRQTV